MAYRAWGMSAGFLAPLLLYKRVLCLFVQDTRHTLVEPMAVDRDGVGGMITAADPCYRRHNELRTQPCREPLNARLGRRQKT